MIEKSKAVIEDSKKKMQDAVDYLDEELRTYRAEIGRAHV